MGTKRYEAMLPPTPVPRRLATAVAEYARDTDMTKAAARRYLIALGLSQARLTPGRRAAVAPELLRGDDAP